MANKALLTGIAGQTASYMAELLLRDGYEVHGVIRRSSKNNLENIKNLELTIHYADMNDESSLYAVFKEVMPDEVYNFAAQSFVKMSYITPIDTANTTGLGTARLLEIIRQLKPDTKFYQASSSEMFGKSAPPQNEETPFYPISPYSTAKVYAYWQTRMYRDAYNMFAVNGILFNHESPRRGFEFVSRKIAKGVSDIVKGREKELVLGNLSAKRDWSHTKDMVEGIYLMMHNEKRDDWVLASGESHTVQEFVEECFKVVNLEWQKYVKIDSKFVRPAEVNHLQGDSTKAKLLLGWSPKYSFLDLVKEMVEVELLKLT